MIYDQQVDGIILFIDHLVRRFEGIWRDIYGEYEISIGSAVLDKALVEPDPCKVLIDSYLRELIPLSKDTVLDQGGCLISIGSFKMHNQAKKISSQTGARLITVPIPLANDSFCTNRCSDTTSTASYRCVFPERTIVDTAILKELPPSSNLLGLGEFVGLYTSIVDYFESRNINPPDNLLAFIADLFVDINREYKVDYELFLKKLAISLIFKCIIMRINRDHQIGCGIDHLIAYILERTLQVPHGKAVYLGTCISLAMFPEWSSFGLDLKTVVSKGIETGLVSPQEIEWIREIPDASFLVKAAIQTRPGRRTVLSYVLKQPQRMRFLKDRL